jgi:hypothetical protein
MIKSIEIENFKCYGANPPAVVECAPITLIYGPNSSGKSTLTQALRLMQSQFSADSPGWNPFQFEHWERRDGYEWMSDWKGMRCWAAGPEEPMVLTCRFPQSSKGEAFVRFRYAALDGRLENLELGHSNKVRFRLRRLTAAQPPANAPDEVVECYVPGEHVGRHNEWLTPGDVEWKDGVITLRDRKTTVEEPSARALRAELAGWGQRLGEVFRRKLLHIGPQRELPKRASPQGANAHEARTTSLDDALFETSGPQLDNAPFIGTTKFDQEWYSYYLKDEETLAATNRWLNKLSVGLAVERRHDDGGVFVRLKHVASGNPLGFPDVGFGVSQVLPIIVAAVAARDQTILVEQPELHIHARLQAELGDLLIESTKTRGNQFIVETHSELLCLRMQRRTGKGDACPSDIALNTIGGVDDNGRAGVKRIPLDEDGEFLDVWPNGFFPERLREVLGG